MRASPLCALALAGAASARSIIGLGKRQNSTAQVHPSLTLVAPTNDTTRILSSCSVGTISWSFTDGVTDTFDIYVTNIGIEFPASTTEGTTTLSRTVASESGPTQPTQSSDPARRLLRRDAREIDVLIYPGLQPDIFDTSRDWQVAVPAGWYKLHAVSQSLNSETNFRESAQFRVYDLDTSCIPPELIGGPTSTGDQPQDTGVVSPPPNGPSSSSSPQPGVIAGAVVGSLFAVAAFGALFLLCLRRRNARHQTPHPAAAAWGHVNSKESRNGSARGLGLPPGTPNRLSRNAEAMVAGVPDIDQDSIEEKSHSGAPSPTFSPEPPIFRRHSQSSQAFILGPVSTRDSRRSTIQSIPTTVTPTNATPAPSPYPGSEPYSSSETAGASVTTVAASLARSNSTAKKLARKPVPVYNPHDSTLPPKGASDEGHDEADLGPQMISQSQQSESVLLSGFPFEMEGAREVHYLIPDPPAPPRR